MIQPELWAKALESWTRLSDFRADRERNKRYTYGRQWDDLIEVDGQTMTEAAYIRSQGSVPLKNNLIRRLVRNVLGVWRNDFKLPKAVARDPSEQTLARLVNKLLETNAQTNRLTELYARTMEEFLISGVAIHRKSYDRLRGRPDCRTDYVHPCRFFFGGDGADFRCRDFSLLGEIHDTTLLTASATLGLGAEQTQRLAAACGADPKDHKSPIRLVEVWQEEYVPFIIWHDRLSGRLPALPEEEAVAIPPDASPKREWRRVWKYRFMAEGGVVVKEGVSPYAHGSHPYVLKVYPFIDGEVHSFVADVIDQQRYTNRLITLYDWVMRSSAKGVLLFPESALPDDADLEEVADEWSRFNGVITYRAKAGIPGPTQVTGTGSYGGINDLLNIQMKMFEDISGVNPALQGKLESSSVSGTLFNQQTRNAMTTLRDLIESYREFVAEATMKDASNLLQFYTPERMARLAGQQLALTPRPNTFAAPELDFQFD